MDLRDYISGFALTASIASLLVSLRTSRFNSRVKAIELKTELRLKASALIRRADLTLADLSSFKKLASRPGLERILSSSSRGEESLKSLLAKMQKFRDDRQVSAGVGDVSDYERHFALVTDVDERMEEIRISQSALKTELIEVLSRIDSRRNEPNKTPQSTTPSVTPPAGQEARQP